MQVKNFEFRGATGEYFKIWLVNTLLTVLTLGVFSAWAKVRARRYFYGNTYFNAANFGYHASPWAILLARVVLLALLIGGALWAGEDAIRNAGYSLLLFLLLPWALVRGLAFNARNSSYCNVRFGFNKSLAAYAKMYWLYSPLFIFAAAQLWLLLSFEAPAATNAEDELNIAIGRMTIIIALPFFLLLPWLSRFWHGMKARGHHWGRVNFVFNKPSIGGYFMALYGYALLLFGLALVFTVVLIVAIDGGGREGGVIGAVLGVLAQGLALFLARARLFQLYWQGVQTPGGAVFNCDFGVMEFGLRILLVNFIASVLSFGMLYPWAAIRKAHFLAARMTLTLPPQELETLAAAEQKSGAFGEEFEAVEGFDFDVGLI